MAAWSGKYSRNLSKRNEMVISEDLLEKKKRNALEILRYFTGFCKEHDLQYYCAFGTAIGAVRHKGFIPWDDDIDVQMPRPDYERLMSLKSSIDSSKYELCEGRFDPDYSATFAKIVDLDTTLVEFEGINTRLGNYIDIFPLDGCPDDYEEYSRAYKESQELRDDLYLVSTHYNLRWFGKRLITGHGKEVCKILGFYLRRSKCRQEILARLNGIASRYRYEDSDNVTCYCMWFKEQKHYMPKEWYGNGTEGVFEGMKVILPLRYDDVLTHIYGDYMTLPPENERMTHHRCIYINLDERIAFEEALKAGNKEMKVLKKYNR